MRYRNVADVSKTSDELIITHKVIARYFKGHDWEGPWTFDWEETSPGAPFTVWKHDDQVYEAFSDTCVDVSPGYLDDNPCTMEHRTTQKDTRVAYREKDYSTSEVHYLGGYSYQKIETIHRWMWQWKPRVTTPAYHATLPPGNIIPPQLLTDMLQRHSFRCRSAIQTSSFDLGLWIWELKDFSRLRELFSLKHFNLLSKIRDGIFTWEFGVKPFLSDLEKMLNVVRKIERKLASLPEGRGVMRIRTNGTLDVENVFFTPGSRSYQRGNFGGESFTDICEITRVDADGTCWAVSHVNVDLRHLQGLQRYLLVGASELGLTNITKTGWNMIPFSFLADWWLNVDKMLEALDVLPKIVPATVRDTTVHAKVDLSAKVGNTLWEESKGQIFVKEDETGTFRNTFYQRWVGPPVGSLDGITPPTLRELLLTSLLAEQVTDFRDATKKMERNRRQWLRYLRDNRIRIWR